MFVIQDGKLIKFAPVLYIYKKKRIHTYAPPLVYTHTRFKPLMDANRRAIFDKSNALPPNTANNWKPNGTKLQKEKAHNSATPNHNWKVYEANIYLA